LSLLQPLNLCAELVGISLSSQRNVWVASSLVVQNGIPQPLNLGAKRVTLGNQIEMAFATRQPIAGKMPSLGPAPKEPESIASAER
jgi:hypothetical protein